MKRLLIAGAVVAVALVAIAIAIAATNGGGVGYGSSAAPAPTPGKTLVAANGMALYVNDQETNGMVLCSGACASIWIPVTAADAPKVGSVTGTLGVVKRPDGTDQATLDGKPLYTFYLDKPGQATGDGFHDAFGGHQFTWHAVDADGSTSSSTTVDSPGY